MTSLCFFFCSSSRYLWAPICARVSACVCVCIGSEEAWHCEGQRHHPRCDGIRCSAMPMCAPPRPFCHIPCRSVALGVAVVVVGAFKPAVKKCAREWQLSEFGGVRPPRPGHRRAGVSAASTSRPIAPTLSASSRGHCDAAHRRAGPRLNARGATRSAEDRLFPATGSSCSSQHCHCIISDLIRAVGCSLVRPAAISPWRRRRRRRRRRPAVSAEEKWWRCKPSRRMQFISCADAQGTRILYQVNGGLEPIDDAGIAIGESVTSIPPRSESLRKIYAPQDPSKHRRLRFPE
jgi:hypothetical protein